MSIPAIGGMYATVNGQQLSKEQYLKEREENNNHVLNHEREHLAAAGEFAVGGIHLDYNSQGWATGGHVNIKMPTLDKSNPQKTIRHAEIVQKAALAPSDPSGQDLKVAAQASKVLFQAQQAMNNRENFTQNISGRNYATDPNHIGKNLNLTT